MSIRKKQAEATAEAFATVFLDENASNSTFIGPYIEQILANKVKVIYQYVEDPKYFGAAITHESGEQFIAINTFHSLRIRFFTVAHELWHLSEASKMQNEDFDHERAADRFAAAIMLPKALTEDIWLKFKKIYPKNQKEALIHVADLAAAPYETVVRRLKEIGISVSGINLSENEWKLERALVGLPDSMLDSPQKLIFFKDYEHAVKNAFSHGSLDRLTAANKLKKYDAEFSRELQEKEIEEAKNRGKELVVEATKNEV